MRTTHRRLWKGPESLNRTVRGFNGPQSGLAQCTADNMFWMCPWIRATCHSDDVQYFNPSQVVYHSHTMPANTSLNTHWPNDPQLWRHHLTKYWNLSCVGVSSHRQKDICHFLLHVVNFSFDGLLWQIASNHQSHCFFFCLKEQRTFQKWWIKTKNQTK